MPTHSRRAFQPAFADEGNAGWPAADRIAPSPGDIKKKCHNRLPIGGTAPTHSRRAFQPALPTWEGLGDRFILQLNEREIQYKTYKALYKRKNLVSYTFMRMQRRLCRYGKRRLAGFYCHHKCMQSH